MFLRNRFKHRLNRRRVELLTKIESAIRELYLAVSPSTELKLPEDVRSQAFVQHFTEAANNYSATCAMNELQTAHQNASLIQTDPAIQYFEAGREPTNYLSTLSKIKSALTDGTFNAKKYISNVFDENRKKADLSDQQIRHLHNSEKAVQGAAHLTSAMQSLKRQKYFDPALVVALSLVLAFLSAGAVYGLGFLSTAGSAVSAGAFSAKVRTDVSGLADTIHGATTVVDAITELLEALGNLFSAIPAVFIALGSIVAPILSWLSRR